MRKCRYKTREKKEKPKRKNEEIIEQRERERERKRERERESRNRLTVLSIDGSVLTETELDGSVSLKVFSVCCADKTVMVRTFSLHKCDALFNNCQIAIFNQFRPL